MPWSLLPEKVTLRLETPTPHPFTLKSDKTALVIVDMQKNIYDRPDSRAYAAIEGNVRLLKKARAAGVPVIFIQNVRKPDSYEFTVFGSKPYMLEGTPETEIIDELAPLPDELVVQKYSYDPFARTELNNLLLSKGILPTDTTVIVTGVSALIDVYSTCVGFKCRHYLTLIPMDCQAAETVEQEARAYLKYINTNTYAFTLSTMIEFSPAGMTTRDLMDVLPVPNYEWLRNPTPAMA
jgi:ureidoacrylate peracid hydrolase